LDLSRIGTTLVDRFPTYSRATEKSCDERVVGGVNGAAFGGSHSNVARDTFVD